MLKVSFGSGGFDLGLGDGNVGGEALLVFLFLVLLFFGRDVVLGG